MCRYRKPYYVSDVDYNTNAPSYYEALARFNKKLKELTERMNDVEQRFKDLILEWLEDGTLADLLEQVLLDHYARKDWVLEQLINYVTVEDMEKAINEIRNDLDQVKDFLENLLKRVNENVTVGSGGDFTTLNEAIEYFDMKPIKPLESSITLLSGFVMDEQVILRNKDFRYLTIVSNDSVVNVENNQNFKECIRVNVSPEFEVVPIFYGKNTHMPTLDAKFKFVSGTISSEVCTNCNDLISGLLVDNSNVTMKAGNGFTHFPFLGVCGINGSNVVGNHCDFSHNGNRDELVDNTDNQDWYGDGVRIWASKFSGSYSKANSCGDIGFHFTHGSEGYIDKAEAIDCGHHAILTTTGSSCSARNGIFTDTIDDNVVSYASSMIDLRESDCSRSKVNYGVIATRTSEINFEHGKANNCGFSGIMANRGSSIDATNATTNYNEMHGIECANNSRVDFSNGTARFNKQDGLHSTHGSIIQGRLGNFSDNKRNGMLAFGGLIYANGCTASNNTKRNIECTRGGYVTAYESQLNYAGEKGVLAYGSKIFISYSTINNSGENGIEATQGGEITAEECTINGSGDKGVLAYSSKIHLSGSSVSNSTGRSVESTQGGEIIARSVNVLGTGNDFNVYNAGRIFAPESTGTANRDINEISEHGLIVGDSLTRG